MRDEGRDRCREEQIQEVDPEMHDALVDRIQYERDG